MTPDLRKLLAPASIAVVGASDRPGPGLDVTRNTLRALETGRRVHLVNPSRDVLFDVPCHKGLADLPEVPDCVVFATSAKIALPVLREAAAMGVGAATVLAGAFAESSQPQGAALQDELIAIAQGAGMALCGPNCVGIADYERRLFPTSMAYQDLDAGTHPRSVALVSQSGGLLIGFVNRAGARRLPLRCFVSSGNEAVTGVEDYLDYLLADEGVRVAAVICESLRDLDRLCRIGDAAIGRGQRIGVVKLGRSERGRRAVRAHTGRHPGDDGRFAAALREAGIAQFDRIDELVEFSHLVSRCGRASGPRISAVMVSGGAAALVSDIAARTSVPFADWSAATVEGLRGLLPEHATVCNPLDLTGGTMLGNREAVERAIRLIVDDAATDLLAFVFPLQPDGGSPQLRNLIAFITGLAPSLKKPLAIVSTSSGTATGFWAEFGATCQSPILEDADAAFAAFAAWSMPPAVAKTV